MTTAIQSRSTRIHGSPVPAEIVIYQALCRVGAAKGTIYSFDPIPDAYSEALGLNIVGSWSSRIIGVRVPKGCTWDLFDGQTLLCTRGCYSHTAESVARDAEGATWEFCPLSEHRARELAQEGVTP